MAKQTGTEIPLSDSDRNEIQGRIAQRDTALKVQWGDKATRLLSGKTVQTVRWLTKQEQIDLDWYASAPVIIFTDGTYLFASEDDEGNGPGALFTSDEKVPTLPVI